MADKQKLGCTQGDTYIFAITVDNYADGSVPDLAGATFKWVAALGGFKGAPVFLQKTDADATFIAPAGQVANWVIRVSLAAVDTAALPVGDLYQESKLTLVDGTVKHIESGTFTVKGTPNP